MKYPIIDLHCDLLEYLEIDPSRTVFDEDSACSFDQLRLGLVQIQVMAIFSPTINGSTKKGEKQVEIFQGITKEAFEPLGKVRKEVKKTSVIASIENGSVFCEEKETWETGKERLDRFFSKVAKLFSISLTWNTENRFGGGTYCDVGLKEDGKKLLDWMAKKNVAVDVSHACDRLIEEIFSYVEEKKYRIPVIATHSN